MQMSQDVHDHPVFPIFCQAQIIASPPCRQSHCGDQFTVYNLSVCLACQIEPFVLCPLLGLYHGGIDIGLEV
jgi:hypothetical protein